MFKKFIAAPAALLLAACAIGATLFLVAPPHAYGQTTAAGTVATPMPGPIIGASKIEQPVVVAATTPPDYTFSAGSVIASIVNWLWVVFGGTIVSVIMIGVQKWLKLMGVQVNQQMNDRIEERLRNGLNQAAATAQVGLDGKFTVAVKNQVVAQAIEYAKAHSAEDLATLGLDPKSGEVTAALQAKAESIIVDPLKATNPALVPNAPTPDKAA